LPVGIHRRPCFPIGKWGALTADFNGGADFVSHACNVLSGEDHCSFCQPDPDLILHTTSNFNVILAIGQIVEGYLLIIPKTHCGCMGELPEDLWPEYLELKSLVRQLLEATYGGCVFYEHGRTGVCGPQPGEQLCYHAHLHAVPLRTDMLELLARDFVTREMAAYSELPRLYEATGPYLFYENTGGTPYFVAINRPIRRQYLRHLAAESIGSPELADWREHPLLDRVRSARNTLSPVLANLLASHPISGHATTSECSQTVYR